jgi:phage-related protein
VANNILPPLVAEIRVNAKPLYDELNKVNNAVQQTTNVGEEEAGKFSNIFKSKGSDFGGNVGNGFLDGLKRFIVPIGGLIAGIGVGAAIKSSVDAFEEMAGSARGMGRVIGGTTEEVSSLAGAMKLSGVNSDTATTQLGRLSRTLVVASGDAGRMETMTEKLGMGFTDATGKVMPMNELLPKLSDKFKSMPDGAEKTALAMQLFGRNGASMLPFLNRGSEGIAELEVQAKKMGLTLDDTAMKGFAAASKATRMFDAQMDGLRQTLGGAVAPVLDSIKVAFFNGVAPAIQQVTEFIAENQAKFNELATVVGDVVTKVLADLVPVVMDLIRELGPTLMSNLKELLPLLSSLGENLGPILGNILKDLLPIVFDLVAAFGTFFISVLTDLAPLVDDLAKIIADTLVSAMELLEPILTDFIVPGLENMAKFVQENIKWIEPLAVAVLAAAGAFEVYNAVMSVIEIGTKAWATAQAILNGTLIINPIGLIIAGVAALVAGIIWVATQTTFFQDAWEAMSKGIADAWNWLWENALKPVFDAISAVFTWIWENIIRPYVAMIVIYVGIWAAIFTWLWEYGVKPAMDAIGVAFEWIYNNIIQPIIDLIIGYIGMWAAIFTWLYEEIITPIFEGIAMVFQWIYDTVIQPIIDLIVGYIGMWGAIFTWLYENAIKPAFDAIARAFEFIWSYVISPVVDMINGAIETIGETVSAVFGAIGGFITGAFNGVVSFFKGIINGFIDVANMFIDFVKPILTEGWVADTLGSMGISIVGLNHIPHLAQGGVIPATPGGRIVRVGEGGEDEAIIPLSKMNQMGGGQTIVVNAQTNATPSQIASSVGWLLRQMG